MNDLLRLNQLKDNLACVDLNLSADHLEKLNQVSQIEMGFPHEFLASDAMRNRLLSGKFAEIDPHFYAQVS